MKKTIMIAALVAACLAGCGGESAADDIKMVFVEGGNKITINYVHYNNSQHKVNDSTRKATVNDFYISKYETTQGLWESVMGYNTSRFQQAIPRKRVDFPVEDVSFDEIQVFIQKLNAKTGKRYRLPTEEEWIYAARGGKKRKGYIYSGSDDIDKVAWYNSDRDGDISTKPVGTKMANELGIHDMTGNVWEWTSTEIKCSGGPCRVIRGGGRKSDMWDSRISYRFGSVPDSRNIYWGFRLARDAEQKVNMNDRESKEKVDGVLFDNLSDTIEILVSSPEYRFRGSDRPRHAIQRVVMNNVPAMRRAYDKRLLDRPDLSCTITTKFVIDVDGKVTSAHVVKSTMSDTALENTVVRMIYDWRFGEIDDDGNYAEVTFPFKFEP